jgi:translation initiation factor 3 subunit L
MAAEGMGEGKSGLPEEVEKFIVFFRMHLTEGNVSQIQSIYEVSFQKLTERYFKSSPWPAVGTIAPLVENDEVFLMLYRELFYRHIHSKLHPTLQQQFDSWENYCNLFNHLLRPDATPLELPMVWLWDMVDEFVYQFQCFCHYRGKSKSRTAEEKQMMKSHQKVWDVAAVISYLSTLAEKVDSSRVVQIYKPDAVDESKFSTLQLLGYFSLISLARVHVLLGDYHTAMQIVEPIEPPRKGLYQKILSAHVTLLYLVGFCLMMMQRFRDAIRLFSIGVGRSKQFSNRPNHDHVPKTCERMYALIAICVSLSPQRLEEGVDNVLREKFADKLARVQQGHEATYEELFSISCPKFVVVAPDADDPVDFAQHAFKLQLKLFMKIVSQFSLIPVLRSYLKLYTSIPIAKLADYLEMKEEDVYTHLISWKNHRMQWQSGSGARGETGEIHFWITNDMVHVRAPKTHRRQADYFIAQITKLEGIMNESNTPSHQSRSRGSEGR